MTLLNYIPDQLLRVSVPVPQARRQPGVRDERAVSSAERRRRPRDAQDFVGKD